MTIEITIQVPDTLGQALQSVQDRLPEVLERGLREVLAGESSAFQDESSVMEILASQPTPEQVLAIHPSVGFQERVGDLLDRGKGGQLSAQEEAELERYLMLEHLVRLAKAHAYKQQASHS